MLTDTSTTFINKTIKAKISNFDTDSFKNYN